MRLRTWLTVGFFGMWAAYFALRIALYLPTHHLDGAFQSASGLFRLSAGYAPGRDFFPYLGVGPLYALYPLFEWFGGNLAASVAAVHFAMMVGGSLIAGTLVYFIARPRSAVLTGATLFIVPAALSFDTALPRLPDWFLWLTWPGNSLRPMRGVIPYVVALAVAAIWSRVTEERRRYAWTAVAIGGAMLWSNDFAAPTVLVGGGVIVLTAWREREWRGLAIFCVLTPIAAIVWLALATLGHVGDLVEYNRGIAHDQWWYFAQYSDYRRVFTWSDAPKLRDVLERSSLVVLGLAIVIALWLRTRGAVAVAAIGLASLGGGLVASIGGHLDEGYFGPLRAWAGMTGVAVAFAVIQAALRDRLRHVGLAVLVVAVLAGGVSLSRYRDRIRDAVTNKRSFFVPELGGFLDVDWQPYVALIRKNKDAVVYEEYWGLWSALTRRFSAWPVDAAIHALGPIRETAAKQLDDAEIIVTTSPEADHWWQSWNVSQNHWVYGPLLLRWEIVATSPATLVWKRSAEGYRAPLEAVSCAADAGGETLRLDTRSNGYFEIELGYSVAKQSRALVLVQNNMSFGADASGRVTLDPSADHVTYIAFVPKDGAPTFRFTTSPKQKVVVTSCRAWRIEIDARAQPAADGTFVTDRNWIRGVAKRWAGFHVTNTPLNRAEFAPGRWVKFVNGDARVITRVKENGPYLEVFVAGPVLMAVKVGSPSEFSTFAR